MSKLINSIDSLIPESPAQEKLRRQLDVFQTHVPEQLRTLWDNRTRMHSNYNEKNGTFVSGQPVHHESDDTLEWETDGLNFLIAEEQADMLSINMTGTNEGITTYTTVTFPKMRDAFPELRLYVVVKVPERDNVANSTQMSVSLQYSTTQSTHVDGNTDIVSKEQLLIRGVQALGKIQQYIPSNAAFTDVQ